MPGNLPAVGLEGWVPLSVVVDGEDVALIPGPEEGQGVCCSFQLVGEISWQARVQLAGKVSQKREALPQSLPAERRQAKGRLGRVRVVFHALHGIPQRGKVYPHPLGGGEQPLSFQGFAQLLHILPRQRMAVHLPGSFRQFVGLVHNEGLVVVEQGAQAALPVSGVSQQVVVVADLDKHLLGSGLLPSAPIAAEVPLGAVLQAGLGDAHQPAVKAAEVGHCVQVYLFPERIQRLALDRIFRFIPHRPQPLQEPLVADIPALALANCKSDGRGQQIVLHQHLGEKGQILLGDGLLQRHAGGGHHHGLDVRGPVLFQQNAGNQVGIGLADAHPRVAEGNLFLKEGVQHGVAQGDLSLPHCHALPGEQPSEDVFRLLVGLLQRRYGHRVTSLSGGKLVRRELPHAARICCQFL